MDVEEWVRARLPSEVDHLDCASAGRVSQAVHEAQAAFLLREAAVGAYVAQGEQVDARAGVAALLGLTADDVALTTNAVGAFEALLQAWPLASGARVGTVASEYGPHAGVLARLAGERGWERVALPVDALGRVVQVPAGLDLVALPQVASQRGVAQPVELLLSSGVPLVLDVAQSLGQTPVPPGCAAYVGTSRKWLCGPRGVGVLAVDPSYAARLEPPAWAAPGVSGMQRFDAAEAHVAGRSGFARAVAEWSPALLPRVHALAATARGALAETPWSVVEPVDEPTGITTLVPPAGVDVAATRERLRAAGLLTVAVPATRSADLAGPVLRVSTAAWVEPAALERLAHGLRR